MLLFEQMDWYVCYVSAFYIQILQMANYQMFEIIICNAFLFAKDLTHP